MCLTLPLSRGLQTVNKDLVNALEGVTHIKNTLKSWRSEVDEWHDECYGPYSIAEGLARSVDAEIRLPRIASRQGHRSNVPAENADEYFKRSIWFPFLDSVIESLETRFTDHSLLVQKMIALIPSEIKDSN